MEPRADTYQLLPKQTWVVATHSPAADGSWPWTLRGDEPFQVDHRPESVTVWVNGNCFGVDADVPFAACDLFARVDALTGAGHVG
ncbi:MULTISPECIES: hypothetical protein [unclassified Streptomyces]|uniref:hypothetical protein n=1 Tax=unclassified Streptomyces TaxID=2593676 RepID=UPI000A42C3B1|nr:hypothetical protein [Streptomyces sp. CB02058]